MPIIYAFLLTALDTCLEHVYCSIIVDARNAGTTHVCVHMQGKSKRGQMHAYAKLLEHWLGLCAGCMRRVIHMIDTVLWTGFWQLESQARPAPALARVGLASLRPASTGVPTGIQHISHCSLSSQAAIHTVIGLDFKHYMKLDWTGKTSVKVRVSVRNRRATAGGCQLATPHQSLCLRDDVACGPKELAKPS